MAEGCGVSEGERTPDGTAVLFAVFSVWWWNCTGEGVCVAEGCGLSEGERTPDGMAVRFAVFSV